MTIRPTIPIPDAISLRDTIRRVVVFNTLNNFLLDEERDTLTEFELKLTFLIMTSETRAKLKEIKAGRRPVGPLKEEMGL